MLVDLRAAVDSALANQAELSGGQTAGTDSEKQTAPEESKTDEATPPLRAMAAAASGEVSSTEPELSRASGKDSDSRSGEDSGQEEPDGETRLDQATVLIVSEDAEFSRAITACWQADRITPTFTLMGADLCHGLDQDAYDVAIVGAVRPAMLPGVLRALDSAETDPVNSRRNSKPARTARRAAANHDPAKAGRLDRCAGPDRL